VKFSLQDASAWERVSPYLDEALDLSPEARAAWLKKLLEDQPDIGVVVEQLLNELAALDARGFLTTPPLPITRLDTFIPVLEGKLREGAVPASGESDPASGKAASVAMAHAQGATLTDDGDTGRLPAQRDRSAAPLAGGVRNVAAVVALLAIIAWGAVATWRAQVASRERDKAVALASRNAAVSDFMGTLISEAAFSSKGMTANELLARSEQLALASSPENKDDRAAILNTLATVIYDGTADVATATPLLDRALALVKDSPDRNLRAEIVCNRAAIVSVGDPGTATSDVLHELDNPDLDPLTASECRASAHFLNNENRLADRYFAETMQKYALAGREHSPAAIVALNNWGLVNNSAGAPKRALELYDRMLAFAAKNGLGTPPPIAVFNRARALEYIGRFAEARSEYERGARLAREARVVNFEVSCWVGLASIAAQSGDDAAARRALDEADARVGASWPANHPALTRRLLVEGGLDLAAGQIAAARAKFEQVLARPGDPASKMYATLGKSEALMLAGDAASAVTEAQAALNIAIAMQDWQPYSNHTGVAWLMLGRAWQAKGDLSQARRAYDAAVANLSNTVDTNHPDLLRARKLSAASGSIG
jgi:tetratricopeptide (TPR) repeat protein